MNEIFVGFLYCQWVRAASWQQQQAIIKWNTFQDLHVIYCICFKYGYYIHIEAYAVVTFGVGYFYY